MQEILRYDPVNIAENQENEFERFFNQEINHFRFVKGILHKVTKFNQSLDLEMSPREYYFLLYC